MVSTSPGTCQQQQPISMRQPESQSPVTWVPLQKDSELWIPVQKDQKPFQCGLCSVMFGVNMELVSHIHNHSSTKPYQCGFCKVSYDNNQELTVHVKMHTMFMIQVVSRSMEEHVFGQTDETTFPPCGSGIIANEGISRDSVVSENGLPMIRKHPTTVTVQSGVLEVNDGKGITLEKLSAQEVVKLENCLQKRNSAEADQRDNAIKGVEFKHFCCDLCGATFKAARYVSDHKRRIHNVYSRQAGNKQAHSQGDENGTASSDVCDLELEVQSECCDDESFTDRVKSVETDDNDKSETETECNSEYSVEHVRLTEIDPSGRCSIGYKAFLCNICNAAFKAPGYVRDHIRRIHKTSSPQSTQKQGLSQNDNLAQGTDLSRDLNAKTSCCIESVADIVESGETNHGDRVEVCTMKSSQYDTDRCDKSEIQTKLSAECLGETVKYPETVECDKSVVSSKCNVDKDTLSERVKVPEMEKDQTENLGSPKCIVGSLMERVKAAETNHSNLSEYNIESLNKRAKSVADQGDNSKDKTESRIESLMKGIKPAENEMEQGDTDRLKVQTKSCVVNLVRKVKSAETVDKRKSRNKPFPCNICGATFKDPRYVRDHKRRIHKMSFRQSARIQVHPQGDFVVGRADPDAEVKLEECFASFAEKSERVESNTFEFETVDGVIIPAGDFDDRKKKIKPFICNICGATFKAARYVRDHKRKIHKISLRRTYQRVPDPQIDGNGLIKLEECAELETDQIDRRNAKQPFRCNICGSAFKAARYVKDHKRRVHNMYCSHSQYYQGDEKDGMNDIRPFACPHCPWQFKTKFALQNHVARVHENKRPFVCPHCKDCFKTRRDLAVHEHRRHMTEEPHECAHCKQTFKVRDDLLQHYCQPKPCLLCNQMLSNNRTYYYHMRHNHKTEPFQCRLCEFNGILTRREIEIHMKTHPNAKPKSFVCEFCGQAFAKLMTLNYHRNGRHLNIKPYKCSICQKSFNSLPNMRNHKLRHSGNKRYTCDRCGKKFFTSGCLLRHSKTHSNLKAYACTECGATYKTHINFAHHLKHSHGL